MPKKRLCDRGADCPYRDEYQHQLEFYHDDEESSPSNKNNKKSKPGNHLKSFTGNGKTVGRNKFDVHGRVANPYKRNQKFNRDDAAMAAEARMLNSTNANDDEKKQESHGQKRKANEAKLSSNNQRKLVLDEVVDLASSPLDDSKMYSNDDVVLVEEHEEESKKKRSKRKVVEADVVDLCDSDCDDHSVIDIDTSLSSHSGNDVVAANPTFGYVEAGFSDHQRLLQYEEDQLAKAIAESKRDATIHQQNVEYEESLANDKIKEFEKKQAIEMKRAQEEREKTEEEEKKSQEEMKRNAAFLKLQPEPVNCEDAATIAFRLPSKCICSRITRKFERTAKAEQLILYLQSCDELCGITNWSLHEVVGQRDILPSQTLLNLNLVPRGVVVVKDLDR